jgi:hypothetical protein
VTPRPITFAISIAFIGVIGLLVFFVLRKDKRPVSATLDEPVLRTEPVSPNPKIVDKPAARPFAGALARPAARARVEPDAGKPPDEESMLAQLHELAGSDPNLSLKIARQAVNRYPDSPSAPEFEWNVVKALFNLRRLVDAEAEARIMLSKYPDSDFTGDVVHHLLNHPPNPSDVPPQ